MDYSLPSDEQILEAALEALKHRRTVRSETALLRSVRDSLRKTNPAFTVGRRRLRLVALHSGKVEVTAFTRFSDERRVITKCPVCRGAIRPLKNRTVYDGSVTLGYRCNECGYWTGIRRRIPTLYVYGRRFAEAAGADADPGLRAAIKIVDSRIKDK